MCVTGAVIEPGGGRGGGSSGREGEGSAVIRAMEPVTSAGPNGLIIGLVDKLLAVVIT